MKREKQMCNGKNDKIKISAVLAVVAAVFFIFVFGFGGNEDAPPVTVAIKNTLTEVIQEELPVSKTEEELLSNLYGTMVNGEYADTARLLNENEEMFTDLLSETLTEDKYCYWEKTYENGIVIRYLKPLSSVEVMEGMVLTRYNTVFYGTFYDGKPEGECHAIQAMVLDEPRYTFAEGTWKNGKMNGEGRTGYHYYKNVPAKGFVMTEKAGLYVDNLLDGVFVYRTESVLGEQLSWEIEAEKGITVLAEKWSHFPLRKEYMIGAKEDSARAYVLSEEKVGALLWNNLITWDE
ncbi:MAG: hypothetical protein IKU20_04860 [Lachnospiraceae bacterium]|nr:hypothetical protein [Lachnospiraceae bacterium]